MELNLIERILIVGLGSIGKRHLRIARKLLPKTDIRVLKYSPINEVPNFADGCFFNLEEALAFGPQLAVIANPAPFHIGIAQELADNGVHLLVEKPLATELDGISRFLDTCQKHNLTLSIGYNLRFSLIK